VANIVRRKINMKFPIMMRSVNSPDLTVLFSAMTQGMVITADDRYSLGMESSVWERAENKDMWEPIEDEPMRDIGEAVDNVNPAHYTDMVIAPNVYITENNLEWEVANVVKYISRYKNKNGIEDLRKAKKYLELLCERVYGEKL